MMKQFELGRMKSWLMDCFEDECDQEQIRELSYEHAVKAIDRYYNGGIAAFKERNGWWQEVEA